MSRAPGRQGLQSITSEQSADTAGVSWRVMSALFAHTAGRVVLEPPREQGGTEKMWETCIQYSWASCFPQSQAVKERCTGLPGDGHSWRQSDKWSRERRESICPGYCFWVSRYNCVSQDWARWPWCPADREQAEEVRRSLPSSLFSGVGGRGGKHTWVVSSS